MRDTSATRRGILTAAGAALLGGCSGVDRFSDEPEASIHSSQLPDVTTDGESDPIVVETVPVEIERARLREATRRVRALLETLPMPFGPSDLPNGYVRRQLIDAATDATTYETDARTAGSPLVALQSLRRARSHARYAAAGWAFVEEGTTKSDLQADHRRAVSEAQSTRADHEYLGVDLVDAVSIHSRVERNLDLARDRRAPSVYETTGELLTVAEWGEHAESVAALVGDSQYLYDRFRATLPTDAGTVEDTLAAAAERLEGELRDRRANQPSEPTEGDGRDGDGDELVWRLRYRLHDDAESSVDRVAGAPGPASAVVAATEGLTDVMAYDDIRTRIEEGERFRVEDAPGLHERRTRALDAIRTALEESPRSGLARPVLADIATSVAFADEELSRFSGEIRLSRLDEPIRRYTTAIARARSVPTACRQVLDVLET